MVYCVILQSIVADNIADFRLLYFYADETHSPEICVIIVLIHFEYCNYGQLILSIYDTAYIIIEFK